MYHIGLAQPEIEHIKVLIARLDAQPPSAAADRRVHPRIDFSHPMWLNVPTEPDMPWVHIYSRNLSTGGLSFLTRAIFYMGQHLVIAHELKEFQPMVVLSRVCFCRTIDLGIQEVGLAFVMMRADPGGRRVIPPEWLPQVVQSDFLARRRYSAWSGA